MVEQTEMPRRLSGAIALAAALLAGVAAGVAAEPDKSAAPELGRRDITADEFRAAFEHKTVHLSTNGFHYGSEYYLPGDRSVWIAFDGPCRLGSWTYEGSRFCFRYEADGPYCWRVFVEGGVYYAESVDGLVLRIYSVDEKPLTCDPELFS